MGHGARYGGLASTGHSVQPEYTFSVGIVGPGVYLIKKADSSVRMASGLVFIGMGVVRGAFGGAQFTENDFLVDIKK